MVGRVVFSWALSFCIAFPHHATVACSCILSRMPAFTLLSNVHEHYAHADISLICSDIDLIEVLWYVLMKVVQGRIKNAHYMSGIIAETGYGLQTNQREPKQRKHPSRTRVSCG